MGTTTYDKLSRGRKQEIDLERRKKLKEAKNKPKSRAVDLAADVLQGMGRAVHGDKINPGAGSERARYKTNRENAIREAQNKADYKDLKGKPTKLFKDKNVEGMSDDEMSKVGDFKVEKYKNGGAVKGYGKARGAKACKMR